MAHSDADIVPHPTKANPRRPRKFPRNDTCTVVQTAGDAIIHSHPLKSLIFFRRRHIGLVGPIGAWGKGTVGADDRRRQAEKRDTRVHQAFGPFRAAPPASHQCCHRSIFVPGNPCCRQDPVLADKRQPMGNFLDQARDPSDAQGRPHEQSSRHRRSARRRQARQRHPGRRGQPWSHLAVRRPLRRRAATGIGPERLDQE